jgi:integrative and conjugative element protein (TIGR02256 family)
MTAGLSAGQQLALDQLGAIAREGVAVELVGEPAPTDDGHLRVEISLACRTQSTPGGLRLRARERFVVLVRPDFPFSYPIVYVPHARWAGFPHVQWQCVLCLYAQPSIEWIPADGMRGFIDRLVLWLEQAALDELDPDDQPLHPPVAYTSSLHGCILVRSNLGDLAPRVIDLGRHHAPLARRSAPPIEVPACSLVVALLVERDDRRRDVLEWMAIAEWMRRVEDDGLPLTVDGRPVSGALAVLAGREIAFEYPREGAALIRALEGAGIPPPDLLAAIAAVANTNLWLALRRSGDGDVDPPPLHLFVGTPSRRGAGPHLLQHLVCWRFDDLGRLILENLPFAGAANPTLDHVGTLMASVLPDWLGAAPAEWVEVMEARPEVTERRDSNTSVEWLRHKRVAVLGCGALGAPIAEYCVRAGAGDVTVVDKAFVRPGILVRQPYSDADIGMPKAHVLSARLNAVRGEDVVHPVHRAVANVMPAEGGPPPQYDLIIDATADAAVASHLELARSAARDVWPPVMAVMVGHDARLGIVTVAKRGASGSTRDIRRRLALAARVRYGDGLGDVATDLFPLERRAALFQPEPGCSSPTFVGSAADLAGLAGQLLDAGLRAVVGDPAAEAGAPMVAAVARLVGARGTSSREREWLGWENDEVVADVRSGYEVRISQEALRSMRAEVRRGLRIRGARCETGGLLLGEIDDACRCVWVDVASGPPPDSVLSPFHFDHGLEGADELVAHHRARSGQLTRYLGMWHAHPFKAAAPSFIDKAAMRTIVTALVNNPSRALVLIVGGDPQTWQSWVDGVGTPEVFVRLAERDDDGAPIEESPVPTRHRAEGWTGGWSSRPLAAVLSEAADHAGQLRRQRLNRSDLL